MEFPWPVYKIKLGRGNDIEIIRSLREITDAVFRVDANAAWSPNNAVEYSKILAGMNVEFIEQPLEEGLWDEMKGVKTVRASGYCR